MPRHLRPVYWAGVAALVTYAWVAAVRETDGLVDPGGAPPRRAGPAPGTTLRGHDPCYADLEFAPNPQLDVLLTPPERVAPWRPSPTYVADLHASLVERVLAPWADSGISLADAVEGTARPVSGRVPAGGSCEAPLYVYYIDGAVSVDPGCMCVSAPAAPAPVQV